MGIWSHISAKVRGAAHEKNNKPCQDAVRVCSYTDGVIVAAVADGHGSDACPYSDEGSAVAVEIVQELFEHILSEVPRGEAFGAIDANKEIWIPKRIENAWKQRVQDVHKEKERESDEAGQFPYYLYGTTILATIAAESFIFALQLGDGDILAVDSDKEVSWLIEPDYTDNGETFSICMEDSWKYIKTKIVPLDILMERPSMIMLSTDGYSNSFSSSDGFLKAGRDICEMIQGEGASYVGERLEEWLDGSSREGSGDDIAMALIFACNEGAQ